jgi:hypothetical protein
MAHQPTTARRGATPDSAREAIKAFAGSEVSADLREVLTRLESYDELMRIVWERLPSDRAGQVIFLTCAAYEAACDVRVPVNPKKKLVTPSAELAACARRIADDLVKPTVFAERLSATGAPITLVEYVELLRETARFYEDLDRETRQLLKEMQFPKQRRNRNLPNAEQIYFARAMASLLRKFFGQPFDAVNAALVTVVFDLPQTITEETVRSWRRGDT